MEYCVQHPFNVQILWTTLPHIIEETILSAVEIYKPHVLPHESASVTLFLHACIRGSHLPYVQVEVNCCVFCLSTFPLHLQVQFNKLYFHEFQSKYNIHMHVLIPFLACLKSHT